MFGEEVTPNHHKLASEFVLLDNFYCDGEVGRRPRLVEGGVHHRLRREDLALRTTASAAASTSATRRRAAEPYGNRSARRGLPLGTRCAPASQLPQLRRVRRPRREDAAGSGRAVPGLDGHFDPGLRAVQRQTCPTPTASTSSSKEFQRVREERQDAAAHHHEPAATTTRPAPRPGTHAARVRRRATTWRSAGSSRRSARASSGTRRRSSSSRTTPRTARTTSTPTAPSAWSSARTPSGSVVDSTQYTTSEHAPHDGADPRPRPDEPVRRRRPADVRVVPPRPDLDPFTPLPARVSLEAINTSTAYGAEARSA